jgi:hypothetical protein
MTTCPICGSQVQVLDSTGDADGFDCPQHGKFKVSRRVLSVQPTKTRGEWEAALERAMGRADPGVWPCVTSHDFNP